MKVANLKEAEFNPRSMSESQLEILKENLTSLGDLGGIVFNRRSGNLVGGHQRMRVLKEEIPETDVTIEEHFETPNEQGTVARGYIMHDGEKFSYREVDWDEQKERIANIAANNVHGGWDVAKLTDLIQELAEDVQDITSLETTGFSQGALEAILSSSASLEDILRKEDVSRLSLDAPTPLDLNESSDEILFGEKELDENLPTNYSCPKCGYQFN